MYGENIFTYIAESKDFLTLSLSLVALIVSLGTFLLRKQEIHRTIRNQLLDLFSKLTSIREEIDKVSKENVDRLDESELGVELDKLGLQKNYLAEQAEYLISKYLILQR